MSVSEPLSAPRDLSGPEPQAACRLCMLRGRTSVLVASPRRKLLKCHACGVTFLDPQPDAREITNHLTHHYITEDAHVDVNFGKLRQAVLSRVAAQILKRRSSGRILDVGCAGGFFLSRYFSGRGWERFGVEPSEFAAAKAAQKGLAMYRGQLLDVELPRTFFDVVTIFDTLSYFREPRKELRLLCRAMRTGGLLVIEQPFSTTHVWRHATPLGRLLGGAPMSLLENGQNFLYQARTMRLLLRESGFEVDEIETLPGNKQRDSYRDVLFASYFFASRIAWHLSARNLVLGPNFVVFASPSQSF
jgi:SAM-dependent methyltransferase